MILVDVNLLVYAHNTGSRHHEAAKEWLNGEISRSNAVGLPWNCLLGLVRLATNPRIFAPPLPMGVALTVIADLLAQDTVFVPQPTARHAGILTGLIANGGVTGNLVPDAHLAALAIEHGLTLCSTDRDFSRFEGLRWINPIA